MTATMAKKSTKPKADRHKTRTLIGIPERLILVIDQLVADRLTDRTTEVVRLVREGLESLGMWPPKPDKGKQDAEQ